VVCRGVLQVDDAQAVRQLSEVPDKILQPVHFLEFRSTTQSLDLGSYLLLTEVNFDLLAYPAAPVTGDLNVLERSLVSLMNFHEVGTRTSPIWMGLHRLGTISGLHVAVGVGWQETQGHHELRTPWVLMISRCCHLVAFPVGKVISPSFYGEPGREDTSP